MHTYELDGRQWVAVALAVISVVLVWLLDLGLGAIEYQPRWWLTLPSFGGFYAGLFFVFDHHVWKLGLLGRVKLVRAPILNGEWVGSVTSSYNQHSVNIPVSVTIRQRWSKMVIRLETEQSVSHSIAATYRVNDIVFPELLYLYASEPKSDTEETMNAHRGTAHLALNDSRLEGDYYSGRGRREIGTIKLKRA